LEAFTVLLKNEQFTRSNAILIKIKEFPGPKNIIIMTLKLLPVHLATSAAGKRAFSALRRLRKRGLARQ